MRRGVAAVGVVLALTCGACRADRSGPEPTVSPETRASASQDAATAPIRAEMGQTSHDVARNQMEVWVANDTGRPVTPTRMAYVDGRFRGQILGERLREIPEGSERGFPLPLPTDPDCGSRATSGVLVITYAGQRTQVRVDDESDVVTRSVARRCADIATARVVKLRFRDRVPVRGQGAQAYGVLLLEVSPTGRGAFSIESISGTHLLMPAREGPWHPRVRLSRTSRSRVLELPFVPARCDPHGFMEGSGATAFKVAVTVGGRPGQLLLRMSPRGSAQAISRARELCGL